MVEIKRMFQIRRDFKAIYKCEGCEATKEIAGYDDSNFHINVIPTFKCDKCGESTNSLGLKAEDKTMVPASLVI